MKSFIICMETAFIAFCAGAVMGAVVGFEWGKEAVQQAEEVSEEETPA